MKYLKYKLFIIALCAALNAQAASTDSIRKPSTVREFRKLNACPTTGKVQTTCPGYVIDHIIPLCAGGPDDVSNMMWQTQAASYKKDVMERAICRRLTVCEKPKQ
jgi:hypothetical protein